MMPPIDSAGKKCLNMLAAVVLILAAAISVAIAANAADYKARIDKARILVAELLQYTAAAESGQRFPAAEQNTLAALRSLLPASEVIEWRGQPVETSNRLIYSRLSDFEKENDFTRRAIYLTEADEILSALSTKLAAAAPAADQRSKDEYKRKLAEILAREEYQKPAEKEASNFTKLIERFLNWIRDLFPETGNSAAAPYDFSTFAKVLQILLLTVITGLIGFGLYKFAPRFFRRRVSGTSAKKPRKTIFGERIDAGETANDLFRDAERLARDGDIRAAIRKGYIALLCDLSDKNVIALEQHKTNRDYLRDVHRRPSLYESVRGLTQSFERHWYGFRPAAAGDWDDFREIYKKAVADV